LIRYPDSLQQTRLLPNQIIPTLDRLIISIIVGNREDIKLINFDGNIGDVVIGRIKTFFFMLDSVKKP